MEFENIGFSKPIINGMSVTYAWHGRKFDICPDAGPQMKLLICAECDLGPVGWSEVGGTEFWLACSRVGYRA
jgi:hypothetical protein